MAKPSPPRRPRPPVLRLQRLRDGFPCLHGHSGSRLAFAAAVCLEDRRHAQGVMLSVRGNFEEELALRWPATSDQVLREWGDSQEATENGAVGVAILLIATLTDYHIVQRSYKNTGIDYWLGLKEDRLFQQAARLEVSGIRRGDNKQVDARVNTKLKQTERSERSGLPAFVVVVEFGEPVAVVVKK